MPLPRHLAALALPAAIIGPAAANDNACFIDVRDTLARATSSGPVRITMTVHDESLGDPVTRTLIVPGAAVHQVSNALGTDTEMLAVDGKAWMRADGEWTELPPSYADLLLTTNASAAMTLLVGFSEDGCTQAAAGDRRTFGFVSGAGDATAQSRLHADAEGRPLLIETTVGPSGSETSTTIAYEYDPAITITPPV